jgi:hypothetical protein
MEDAPVVLFAADRDAFRQSTKQQERHSVPIVGAQAGNQLLIVALEEGKGVNAYARAAGIGRSSMSRYFRDIGDGAKNTDSGLGPVKVASHP